jgi:FkbM family methyltransferase
MIITNILKGIRKRLFAPTEKSRFAPIPWLTVRILKNESDQTVKQRKFPDFILNYIRPYEVVKTYQEIFEQEIYRFGVGNIENNELATPIILDCGANIGLSSIYFKTIYPNAELHAFEPDEKIFSVLEKNMRDNHFKKVHLHQAAVWTENTQLSFVNKGSEASAIDASGQSEHKVSAIKLADYMNQFEKIDFLKMDIEGAEFEVVQDCAAELHKVQHFFLEYHGLATQTSQLNTLLQIVEKAGFKVYIKMAADHLKSPFFQKATGEIYDVQLNIFCYR